MTSVTLPISALFMCQISTALSQLYYPDFFNVALNKIVTFDSQSSVCGRSAPDEFCESRQDMQSVLSCAAEKCNMGCPFRDALPTEVRISAFDRAVPGFAYGDCLKLDPNFLAPHPLAKSSKEFLEKSVNGTDVCYMDLDPNWMAPFNLMGSEWTSTIGVWLHPKDQTVRRTIVDFSGDSDTNLRISLERGSVVIRSKKLIITDLKWQVPDDQWTHLALQIYKNSVSVFINGLFVAPAYYKITLGAPITTTKYRIGNTQAGDQQYVGYMDEMQIFTTVLTNREIRLMYDLTFPEVRMENSCRCPLTHPALKKSNPLYCVQNEGEGRELTEKYRISRDAHPLEFINDGVLDSAWISNPGDETTSFVIDFEQVYEVHHVKVTLYSPYPSLMKFEHQSSSNGTWQVWQYFSQDCIMETGYQPEGMLTYEDDIICKYFYDPKLPQDQIMYSSAVVTLDLLKGRPGNLGGGDFTPALRQLLQASAIRVTLRGHPNALDERHKYHAIYEVKVNATCDCHGKGTSCDTSVKPYKCTCSEDTFAGGDQCDACINGTFKASDLHDYASGLCQPCACNLNGTQNLDEACSKDGGQCSCKSHVTGRQCDLCEEGFYNLLASNPAGCEVCICNTTGTVNGSSACDQLTGQCLCKRNVGGLSCDQCLPGYYTLDFASAEGCDHCSCDQAGTYEGLGDCDQFTGACTCKEHVIGLNCDSCAEGYFNLSMNNSMGCESCECNALGSVNHSCDSITGQCLCKLNVAGRQCSVCVPGFFALDHNDFDANGCTHKCNCTAEGTANNMTECSSVGGQCKCRENVQGRSCDTCVDGSYSLDIANKDAGCLLCECDPAGTVNGSTDCDKNTGQCRCKPKTQGRQCNECSPGSFGLSSLNPEGCQDCECSPFGAMSNDCDAVNGQCPCHPEEGEVKLGGRQCMPYLTSFNPMYGPESGGTRIEISAGYLGNMENITVQIKDIECPVLQRSPTSIICLTKSLRSVGKSSYLNEKLDLSLTLSDGSVIRPSGGSFIYKEDPIVEDVHPLHTILSGGIVITVEGDHLNSVAYPKFEVYAVYNRKSGTPHQDVFTSDCIVENATQMKCPTPPIRIQDNLIGRSIPSRRRRDASEDDRLNKENLEFYVGFHLDGVTEYRNLSDTSRGFGVLNVYKNPEFFMFEEDDHLRIFRTYWPFNDKRIDILGKRMNYGATVDDYIISIGQELGQDMQLHDNLLAFTPPETQPEPHEHRGLRGYPDVLVKVGNIAFLVGFVRYETNFWENPTFRYGVIGGICGLLFLILFLICVCCLCKRQRRLQEMKQRRAAKIMENSFDEFSLEPSDKTLTRHRNVYTNGTVNSDYMKPSTLTRPGRTLQQNMTSNRPGLMELLPQDLKLTVEECLLDENLLNLGKLIGEGQFGRVYIGRLSDGKHPYHEPVAVKTLREYNISMRDLVQFLEEATLMSQFHHDHVLGLTGVVVRDNHPYVVLPFMENGDLKSFISNDENMLTVGELIHFGMQISDGMTYLGEKHFVHRDLACRNCMINKDMIVKVADFGLSRDIYTNDYYKVSNTKRPLPVKWMAIESLETGVFDTKSDVWSFGVVLWELLTRGCQPYPDVDNFDVKTYIVCGNRMDRPDYAPDEMYSLMLECWDDKPINRPTFRKIYNRIAVFLDESSSRTILRNKQGQQVPSIAYRGRSFIDVSTADRMSFDYNQF